jgi:hypothetical protein
MNQGTPKNPPKIKPLPEPEHRRRRIPPFPKTDKEHEGATEDQVTDTTPPAGPAYEDDPRQG